MRMLSIMLQEFNIHGIGSRLSQAPREVVAAICHVLPLRRLRVLAHARLRAERAQLPVVSEYLQVDVTNGELLACVNLNIIVVLFSLSPMSQSLLELVLAAQAAIDSTNSLPMAAKDSSEGEEDTLWTGESDTADPDYNWECLSGLVLSDEGWVTWTGTVQQMNIPQMASLATADRRTTQPYNESNAAFPPELLPGCKVSKAASTAGSSASGELPPPSGGGSNYSSLSGTLAKKREAKAAEESKLTGRLGTCIDIVEWEGNPGGGRVIKWDDDGTEETVCYGAGKRYDVTHLKFKAGKVAGIHPPPYHHSSILANNYFGQDCSFGVVSIVMKLFIDNSLC